MPAAALNALTPSTTLPPAEPHIPEPLIPEPHIPEPHIPDPQRSDLEQLDALITAFYGAFDNRNGRQPSFQALHALFTPRAVIAKAETGGFSMMTVEQFITPRVALLTEGRLRDFHEWETSHTTQLHGDMATRSSEYRKEGQLDHRPYLGQGTKTFQLIREQQGWKILSFAWQDQDLRGA